MEISEYRNIFENETSHFFYVANHQLVISLVQKYLNNKKGLKLLDAGCGTGMLAKRLAEYGNVVGVDISSEALKFARKRKIKTKLASVEDLPFEERSFDLVTSLDVIYHQLISNDLTALKEFERVLKPGGILIIRVPANSWLITSHDRIVHTNRRYNKDTLARKLLRVGFKIERISYINAILLPFSITIFLLEKLFRKKSSSSAVTKIPKLINFLLTNLLIGELKLLNFTNLPFGLGLIAVCRKIG